MADVGSIGVTDNATTSALPFNSSRVFTMADDGAAFSQPCYASCVFRSKDEREILASRDVAIVFGASHNATRCITAGIVMPTNFALVLAVDDAAVGSISNDAA